MSKVECDTVRLVTNIKQLGDRVKRGISNVMVKEGEKMHELAVSYAPVDKGNLEEAIQLESTRSGVHGRTVVTLFVDESFEATDSKTVGDYLTLIHEGLAPYGSGAFNLGKKSKAKRDAGNDVGGKFLERAVDERANALASAVQKIVDRGG